MLKHVVLAVVVAFGWASSSTAVVRTCPSTKVGGYEIGVYYYPGWHTTLGRPWAVGSPWDPLFVYPEREPLLGWYRGDDPSVMAQQMEWMCRFSINYVVFDWYFDKDHTRLQEPIDIYLSLSGPKPKFSLLWANHNHATTPEEWERIITFWADNYLSDPMYYTIGGRSVVYIFSLQKFANDAAMAGSTLGDMLALARRKAHERGFGDFYFVGGVTAGDAVIATAAEAGVDSLSAYNLYERPVTRTAAHGYPDLDWLYREQWDALAENGPPLITPMTAGWDRRPWGGSLDSQRDRSMASPREFLTHLVAARAQMDASGRTRGVICCWNEYGEGSVIEPSREQGAAMLEAVLEVFGGEPPTRRSGE